MLFRRNYTSYSFFTLFATFWLALSTSAFADLEPDYAREARLAEQIVGDIFDGGPVWLQANNHSFLSIYTENEGQNKGTVILLHGRGYHPDWPDVVGPLRVGLVEAGWSTLSVQMPVLAKGKKYFDYLPLFEFAHGRIEAAIDYINSQNKKGSIVLAAHSCGAHMANDWLNSVGDKSIGGYIIMGAGATDYRQRLQTPFPFAQMQVPILDLYGEYEFPRPLEMLPKRQNLLTKGGHPDSTLQMLSNTDHYFHDTGAPLIEAVAAWLKQTNFTRSP